MDDVMLPSRDLEYCSPSSVPRDQRTVGMLSETISYSRNSHYEGKYVSY